MRELDPDEAKALFVEPLLCEDYNDWEIWPLHPNTTVLTAGLLRTDGVSARLIVELLYTRSHKTNLTSYRFTVFRRGISNEPAYQLHVTQSHKMKKHDHSRPHQHFGKLRELGDAEWSNWSYDEVLAHFCATTNITFSPMPPNPGVFALKG